MHARRARTGQARSRVVSSIDVAAWIRPGRHPPTPRRKAAAARPLAREIEVAGENRVGRVKEPAADSRVRRIRAIGPDGDIAREIPLAYGPIAGGAGVIAAVGTRAARVRTESVETDEDAGAD